MQWKNEILGISCTRHKLSPWHTQSASKNLAIIIIVFFIQRSWCSSSVIKQLQLTLSARSQVTIVFFSLLWLDEKVARDFKSQSWHVFISDKTMAKSHESIILKPPQFHTMCIFFDGTKSKTKGAMNHLKFESFVEVMLNNLATESFLLLVKYTEVKT